MATVFEFEDYRAYLNAQVRESKQKGVRTRLSEALRVQPAFVSRVLSGDADLSHEHALSVANFFGHSEEETEFFLLLHLQSRAGTAALQEHYRLKLDRIRERRREISARVRSAEPTLPHEDLAGYYGSWQLSAIHVLATIPEFQDRKKIAERLNLSLQDVNRFLEFLERVGLVKNNGQRIQVLESRVHLPANSPFAGFHHMNWRMRGIESLSSPHREDLHYSGPLSFAKSDLRTIRSRIVALLEDVENIVRPSKEETVAALTLDFFEL